MAENEKKKKTKIWQRQKFFHVIYRQRDIFSLWVDEGCTYIHARASGSERYIVTLAWKRCKFWPIKPAGLVATNLTGGRWVSVRHLIPSVAGTFGATLHTYQEKGNEEYTHRSMQRPTLMRYEVWIMHLFLPTRFFLPFFFFIFRLPLRALSSFSRTIPHFLLARFFSLLRSFCVLDTTFIGFSNIHVRLFA